MKIQESSEMYLETILVLSHKNPQVRSIDVVNALDFKKSSVSVAMKKLRENGYIEMDNQGYIKLTDKGQEIAETMFERHVFFSDWLIKLGVDQTVAVEDACRIEHVISPQSFAAIKNYVKDAKF
ncbi:MAG TPA: metal-dependent transcriptional regulator [Syntrophomonas sp.]|nr:metal-dependent transcriptional regulator [Syntrophomonas sp.]